MTLDSAQPSSRAFAALNSSSVSAPLSCIWTSLASWPRTSESAGACPPRGSGTCGACSLLLRGLQVADPRLLVGSLADRSARTYPPCRRRRHHGGPQQGTSSPHNHRRPLAILVVGQFQVERPHDLRRGGHHPRYPDLRRDRGEDAQDVSAWRPRVECLADLPQEGGGGASMATSAAILTRAKLRRSRPRPGAAAPQSSACRAWRSAQREGGEGSAVAPSTAGLSERHRSGLLAVVVPSAAPDRGGS